MIAKSWLALTATATAAAIALAGCAASGNSPSKNQRPEGRVLQTAAAKIEATSFSVAYSGSVSMSSSGVNGLSPSFAAALSQLESELNSSTARGSAQFDSRDQFAATLSDQALNSAPIEIREVQGQRYASTNGGSSWYQVPGAAAGQDSTSGAVPSQLKGLFKQLESQAKVEDLGTHTLNGVQVRELETQLPGTSLQSLLGQLGSQGAGVSAGQLAQFINFGTVTAVSSVATSSGRLQQLVLSGSASVSLDGLGLLDPSAAQGSVSGTVSMKGSATYDFANFGQSFQITTPAPLVAGTPTLDGPLARLADG